MSIVSTVVFLSQSLRAVSVKLQKRLITSIEKRIKQVEDQQVKCEQHRSKLMHDCHQKHYAELAAAEAEYEATVAKARATMNERQRKSISVFVENKRTIALTSQAASNELKRELAMLGSELDHLIK